MADKNKPKASQPTMAELLKRKQEKAQESYYQKHQATQKGKPASGKEINIGRTGGNKWYG